MKAYNRIVIATENKALLRSDEAGCLYLVGGMMVERHKRLRSPDPEAFEFSWWAIPGGVLLALILALISFWLERQGIWPDWLGFSYDGGFFDKNTGDRIPLLKE